MARNTTKKDPGTIKRHSTTGCLAKKTTTTNKKGSSSITRDARSGRFVDQKAPRSERTSVENTTSKADRMFERAWKDTYEKRERRVS